MYLELLKSNGDTIRAINSTALWVLVETCEHEMRKKHHFALGGLKKPEGVRVYFNAIVVIYHSNENNQQGEGLKS